TLVRSATNYAEARELMDELTAVDAGLASVTDAAGDLVIDRAALTALAHSSMARARNLLRWFVTRHDLVLPSSSRLSAMLEQFLAAAPDRGLRICQDGAELGIFHGRIVVHAPPVAPFSAEWRGEP